MIAQKIVYLLILLFISFSPLLYVQKMNKYLRFEAPSKPPKGEHKESSEAMEPWHAHPEDGGPVCLLPCLKAAWGFFSPSSFPLCM